MPIRGGGVNIPPEFPALRLPVIFKDFLLMMLAYHRIVPTRFHVPPPHLHPLYWGLGGPRGL